MGPIHETLGSLLSTSAVTITYVFLASTMFSIGLAVTVDEFFTALRDLKLMGRIVLANILLVPILGMLLVKLFPLSADTRIAILLLAITPGGMQAIQFTAKVRGAVSFAAAVTFLLSIIGVLASPLLADLILPLETRVRFPWLHAMGYVLLFLLLPLLVGFAVRYGKRRLAEGLGKPVLLLSNISFVATIALSMAVRGTAIRAIGWAGLGAMAFLIVSSMAIGWWLGGPDQGKRQVSAVATSMRNAAVCLLIAVTSFPGRGVETAVVSFMALMVPPNMLLTLYRGLRTRRRPS
ncbi:MAG: bile acid:sodium symporter [Syntrophobacteraceae bacterium]|nr:bile acid:sodium symporter [Syntrophobacteraceae bacterium]